MNQYSIFYNGGKGKGVAEASAEYFDNREAALARYEDLLEQARFGTTERVHGLYLMQVIRDWRIDLDIAAFTQKTA